MAIINSTAVGSGSKSVGVFTYRQSRGRTIASQRITKNASKTDLQISQRNGFGEMGRLAQVLSPVIDLTFEKSRYGSSRNNFISYNKQLMEYVRGLSDYNPEMPPLKNLCDYLSAPGTGLKVMLSKGGLGVIASFEWDENKQLNGTMYLSRSYKPGDKITIYAPYSYQTAGAWFDSIKMYSKVLNDQDIASLTVPNGFDVNVQTMPELSTLTDLPKGVVTAQFMVAGVVEDSRKRTTSFLNLLPELTPRLWASGQLLTSEREMLILFKDKEYFISNFADHVVNAHVLFDSSPKEEAFYVDAIKEDTSGRPIGIIVKPYPDKEYKEPLAGHDMGLVPVELEGETLFLIENVISPDLKA